jgi:protein O-GlcNAc transferase
MTSVTSVTSVAEKLRAAFGRLQARDLAGAARLCGEVLSDAPGHRDALHLLGVVRLAGGNADEAASLIGKALEGGPSDVAMLENLGLAHFVLRNYATAETLFRDALMQGASHGLLYMRLGIALASQGKLADAVTALREAAARSPDIPDVHLNLGNTLAENGQAEEALACYARVLALQPDHPAAHFNLGNLHRNAGRLEEAELSYHRVLAVTPEDADAHSNLGVVYERQGRLDEAAGCFRQALALNPDHIHALSNLGNVLRELGLLEEAAASCERALAMRPNFVDALINLGNVRAAQSRPEEAQALYERALRIDPRNADVLRNLGALLRTQGRMKEALACYRKGLEANPGQAELYNELGTALRDSGDFEAAIAAYQKAITIDPQSVHAYYNLAETLKVPGRFDEAIALYERALALKPNYFRALNGLVYLRQHVCDWNGIDTLWERLQGGGIGKPGSGVSPFSLLYMPFSAAEQLACSREWARSNLGPLIAAQTGLGMDASPRTPHARLRIGYLSWDFHQHATSYLVAELFELHDRTRFEVFTYSYGPDDGSAIRARIRDGCEHYSDVAGESFIEIAQRIRRDGIDVLVDLKGYTLGSRPQILALRPAPVQVNWLGFPGSMGTECVDYLLADPFIVPEGAERHYAEKVVRLPDCYQVNDRKREVGGVTPSRQDCGLPADGVVFCSFNQTAKILPDVFAAWMRILKAVPGAVLWLLETNRWATANLRRAATVQDVPEQRLVFASRQPLPEHLARYRVADLSLDTYPYTSHTTASDALWAGCPLVTRTGETFASRVAGSILINAGMRELVTDSPGDYERKVLELATAPGKLADIRRRLHEARDSCPLFDTPRFVRNLESAYETMFDAYVRSRG